MFSKASPARFKHGHSVSSRHFLSNREYAKLNMATFNVRSRPPMLEVSGVMVTLLKHEDRTERIPPGRYRQRSASSNRAAHAATLIRKGAFWFQDTMHLPSRLVGMSKNVKDLCANDNVERSGPKGERLAIGHHVDQVSRDEIATDVPAHGGRKADDKVGSGLQHPG